MLAKSQLLRVEKAAKVRHDMHADSTYLGLREKVDTGDLYLRFVS
jgi:hypothetical protein